MDISCVQALYPPGTAVLFPCEADDVDIGVGVVDSGEDTLTIQFWGGGQLDETHKPCYYTSTKQERETGAEWYYGEPTTWREKKQLRTNRKVTIEVPAGTVFTSFDWLDGHKIPNEVLLAHCPELIH